MRHRTHRVIVNGQEFAARHGEVLLDAALMNGVDIPYDCRSGHCGTCRVRVVNGALHGQRTRDAGQACQCRVISDVAVMTEDVPAVTTTAGRVAGLTRVAPDVVEVRIACKRGLEYLPGQYFRVQFRGMPARCFSPTVSMEERGDGRTIHLHVRQVPNGRVTGALGRTVRNGHKVKLIGPYGAAYFQPKRSNRLVLVAGGTGFAPIWSIADAAVRENYYREMVLIVGVRSLESLYMIPALYRLAECPNVKVVPVVETFSGGNPAISVGRPTDYLPSLTANDIIYAAGVPPMVAAIEAAAQAVGAVCYSDPFVSTPDTPESLLARAINWLSGETHLPSSPSVSPDRDRPPVPNGAAVARPSPRALPDTIRRGDVRGVAGERAHAPAPAITRRQYEALAAAVEHAHAGRASLHTAHGVARR
jgi:3-phenylpropionate/trans-cinnamate dioxygenase ferredoxin reductase subunit